MSNRLKEIKSHRQWAKSARVYGDRYADDVDWLIRKVGRLREKYKEAEARLFVYTRGEDRKILREIDSLTKERDELKQFQDWANIQLVSDGEAFSKLEAELERLKSELKEIRIIKTHPDKLFEIYINGVKQ